MSYYKNHIFICTNQKDGNRKCCANQNAREMAEYAKLKVKELGLPEEAKFRVSTSGCMGRCNEGPVAVVYPHGTWYSYQDKEDIDQIIDATLKGQVCDANLLED